MQNVNKTKITIEQHGGDIYETEINKRELIIEDLYSKKIALSFIENHLLYKKTDDDIVEEMQDYTTKRLNNDQDGQGRFCIHFLALVTHRECQEANKKSDILADYRLALRKAKKYFGTKYRGKNWGGMITFYDSQFSGDRDMYLKFYNLKYNIGV